MLRDKTRKQCLLIFDSYSIFIRAYALNRECGSLRRYLSKCKVLYVVLGFVCETERIRSTDWGMQRAIICGTVMWHQNSMTVETSNRCAESKMSVRTCTSPRSKRMVKIETHVLFSLRVY